MRLGWVLLGVLAGGGAVLGSASIAPPGVTEYTKMCNASAAVAIGDGLFVVADDEDKGPTPLRLYRVGQGGEPLSERPIPDDILDLDPGEDPEVDIEGAAQVGDRSYWIGSHSASKKSKPRPNRRRLFATRLRVDGQQLTIERVGKPYKNLIDDLAANGQYGSFHLKEAAMKEPKADGALSIEGLASTPDGELLIGFRNPVTEGRALVARLKNPEEVVASQPAKFGKPINLDLGRRGIRSMERQGNHYVIIAGPHDQGNDFKLYRWSGDPDKAPQEIPGMNLDNLHPEAMFFDAVGAYILSDDGKLPIDGPNCEDLPRPQRRVPDVMIVQLAQHQGGPLRVRAGQDKSVPSQPGRLFADGLGGAGAEDDPTRRSKLECHVLLHNPFTYFESHPPDPVSPECIRE